MRRTRCRARRRPVAWMRKSILYHWRNTRRLGPRAVRLSACDEQLAQRQHRGVRWQGIERGGSVRTILSRLFQGTAEVWLDLDSRGLDACVLHPHGEFWRATAATG